MEQLRKFVAPEIVFGPGALEVAGRYARNLHATKILLVTDPGVIAAGWVAKAIDQLAAADLPYTVFADVSPNPRAEEVMLGAEVYVREGCDVILAVGGGSPMDCAKCIGVVSTNRRHVLEFEGVDRVDAPGPPLICIPTTSGTSADVSQFAIISNTYDRCKIAIISKTVVPDVALVDPLTTTTMDPYLSACTGMDALAHAFEAMVSTAGSPLTALHAQEAARLIYRNLPRVIDNPDDLQARNQVMLGSLEAGLAFSNASLGAVHAMSHSLGGWLDLPHGECNSILLDCVIAFNWPSAHAGYRRLGAAMGLEPQMLQGEGACRALTEAIARLKDQVGIKRRLGDCGVSREDLPQLAQNALQDPCMATNPVIPTPGAIARLYEQAL
jgi:alcohol dehydrogenase